MENEHNIHLSETRTETRYTFEYVAEKGWDTFVNEVGSQSLSLESFGSLAERANDESAGKGIRVFAKDCPFYDAVEAYAKEHGRWAAMVGKRTFTFGESVARLGGNEPTPELYLHAALADARSEDKAKFYSRMRQTNSNELQMLKNMTIEDVRAATVLVQSTELPQEVKDLFAANALIIGRMIEENILDAYTPGDPELEEIAGLYAPVLEVRAGVETVSLEKEYREKILPKIIKTVSTLFGISENELESRVGDLKILATSTIGKNLSNWDTAGGVYVPYDKTIEIPIEVVGAQERRNERTPIITHETIHALSHDSVTNSIALRSRKEKPHDVSDKTWEKMNRALTEAVVEEVNGRVLVSQGELDSPERLVYKKFREILMRHLREDQLELTLDDMAKLLFGESKILEELLTQGPNISRRRECLDSMETMYYDATW